MMKNKLTNRDRLLRMTRGEDIDNSICYDIEFSVDIRGNITIWGGSSHIRDEILSLDYITGKNRERVHRTFVPIYEYSRLSPYTARIAQIEQDIEIPDERLIEEYERFRETHPEDGFGMFVRILNIGKWEDGELNILFDRTDKEQVRERLLKQERQDILNLWGVDCPPDINSSTKYGERLSRNQGQVSDWFRTEFERIGGDFRKLYSHI